ncbi:MAG: DUF6868 family protein [Pseudoruegeria sp.]
MSIETLATFFGWYTVVSFAFLIFASIALTSMRGLAVNLHARMTGVAQTELPKLYFTYLANFKILALCLGFIPWLCLKLMGA